MEMVCCARVMIADSCRRIGIEVSECSSVPLRKCQGREEGGRKEKE